MKALVFPGQGSQFSGMGKNLYETSGVARNLFDRANEILGFDIQAVMFEGTEDDLKRTSVTQPAIYIHSVIASEAHELAGTAGAVAGHSLGEFSALAAAGVLSFEDGLRLVAIRANAMQKACDLQPSTMAAILGMDDAAVEALCREIEGEVVVPANYNTVGQVVISGTREGIARAIALAPERGASRAIELQVNGAFHSPLMEPARLELAEGIATTHFEDARVAVYQNVTARPHHTKAEIRENLLQQLTSPVRWSQTIRQMQADGVLEYIECGPGKVLSGLIKKVDRAIPVSQIG
ncbi:MAG: ACP S-malonyltransferase [Bacteroidia bacterium]|jgi:[acyl-carrier-protein] S-malonyltransferase|nr:ACP S-malonyltransferase [Bacteroidia bacterium]